MAITRRKSNRSDVLMFWHLKLKEMVLPGLESPHPLPLGESGPSVTAVSEEVSDRLPNLLYPLIPPQETVACNFLPPPRHWPETCHPPASKSPRQGGSWEHGWAGQGWESLGRGEVKMWLSRQTRPVSPQSVLRSQTGNSTPWEQLDSSRSTHTQVLNAMSRALGWPYYHHTGSHESWPQ